jgi:hypothetical protein
MGKFASIPTLYNGVQFRSRLEARWARLFDLLGWEWEYEPFDLLGWIPDFIIKGNPDILVEVKPYTMTVQQQEAIDSYLFWLGENPRHAKKHNISDEWLPTVDKILKASPIQPTLLLGGGIITGITDKYPGHYEIGNYIYKNAKQKLAMIPMSLKGGKSITLHYTPVLYMVSAYPKSHEPYLTNFPRYPLKSITHLWKEAGNTVQWRRANL